MGGGAWTSDAYTTRSAKKMATEGTVFDYDKKMRSRPPSERTAHETLDPKRVNGAGAHEGLITRECLDSDEHPNSTPIAVFFDVTGSMGGVPRILQTKLPGLLGVLQRKAYVDSPQILFGAIGDAHWDKVPLQVGQFESDNRMGEQLESIYLEGGGGGGNHESYQLAAYMMAHHTHLDSVEKRGQKGYLFIIGDERVYRSTPAEHVERFLGQSVQGPIDTAETFEALREKFHVFFLYAQQASYTPAQVISEEAGNDRAIGWAELLGQHAMVLTDAAAVSETIALTIGVMEGRVDITEGAADLADAGLDATAIASASKAVATVAETAGSIAAVEGGSFEETAAGTSGAEAL